ncbi:MAG TPA: CHAT domain-containing protein, partial [Polyangium sp.]|nr:CHAT domain-containing protein [Polyangium sp.]
MSNPDRSQAPIWLELIIDRAGNDVRISARGSRDEQVEFRSLGIAYDALIDFAMNLEKAATYGQPLTAELLATARAIHEAVTDGEIGLLLGRLTEAAQGSLLVRFLIHDPTLKSVPWEAICSPHQARGFWAVSPELFPVRGILSSLPWKSIGVENAVHVLAIAPTDEVGLVNLQQALSQRIPSGEVAWLEPLKGPMATKRSILERLRREPRPHVIHFVGHGRVEKDVPALRAADEADEECWLDVEVFAQEIAANLQGQLRLVVLEACEGARQSAFSSAAEIIAHAGVQAVVAHGWPVRANIAQICSTQLYHTLVGAQQRAGNIVTATNDARRAILTNADGSAESISPILYLRGADGALFNFEQRKLIPLILGGVGAVGVGIGAAVYKHSSNDSGNLTQQNIHPESFGNSIHDLGQEIPNSSHV